MAGACGSSTYGPLQHPEKPSYSQSLCCWSREGTPGLQCPRHLPKDIHAAPTSVHRTPSLLHLMQEATVCKCLGKTCASLVGMSSQQRGSSLLHWDPLHSPLRWGNTSFTPFISQFVLWFEIYLLGPIYHQAVAWQKGLNSKCDICPTRIKPLV